MTTAFWSDGRDCIEREIFSLSIQGDHNANFDYIHDVKDTCEWIVSNNFKRVCLQFPDNMLESSVKIYEIVKSNTNVDLYVLGDTSYSNCCVDEIAAKHVLADAVVHYGHACFSGSKLPVLYVLPKHLFDVSQMNEKFQNTFSRGDSICLFYDAGLYHVKDILSRNLFEAFPNAFIAHIESNKNENSIMGRLIYDSNFEQKHINTLSDHICIYVGQRGQTSFNCAVSIPARKWKCLSTDDYSLYNMDESVWFKRRRFLIEKCKDASTIGVLVCKICGDTVSSIINRIKELCKLSEKKCYIISVGKPNVPKLANFPEIDVYVMVACTENELYSSRDFFRPIVYPYELEVAVNSNRENNCSVHITDYEDLLIGHRAFIDLSDVKQCDDMSLVTGRMRQRNNDSSNESTNDVSLRNNMTLEKIGNSLSTRTWNGLEQKLGETAVVHVEEGRSGLAAHYKNEHSTE